MASAKFLEEALSTDVDESAVNAIVGSLETQLVTASPGAGTQVNSAPAVNQNHVNSAISNGGTPNTQKHGVANGGAGESVNILLNNSDAVKSSLTPHSVTNVVGAIPASGYINQIQQQQSAPVATTSNQQQSSVNLIANKHHEPIKILYPNNNNQTLSSVSAGGVVNLNSNRVTFPVGTLPNGNITQQTVLNAVTSSVQSVVSQSIVNSNVNKGVIGSNNNIMVEAKPQLVIKTTSAGPQPHLTGMVTVPMTMTSVSHTGSPGVVTLAKNIVGASQQQVMGTHPSGTTTLLPGNVQILNVNAVRPSGPAGQGQKSMPQRVVIGAPHMVGARPGQPGVRYIHT
jgi:transcription initiation factor TFIID subunit 4